MARETLISFDLRADLGFLKKPDHNDGLILSYNMLHRPALLGILGAIAGMEGYQRKGELPSYYLKLQDLLLSIEPLGHEKGNFQKSSVKYTNTVGYANEEGPLLVEETMLIRPAYRCYLLLDLDNPDHEKLYQFIGAGYAEYIPYFGKNEYQAWIDGPMLTYEHRAFKPADEFNISSLFIKDGSIRKQKVRSTFSSVMNKGSFCYFERLPVGFDEELCQYELGNFAYTDWTLKPDAVIDNLYEIVDDMNTHRIIQLF